MNKQELAEEITELVKAFRQGDEQAFNRLVFLFQTKIYNLCLNYVKAPEEAKDLAQDIFVTAYRALPKLREEKKFAAWLYQIAVNHCRNRYKRLSRRGFFSNRSLDDPDTYLQVTGDESPEKHLEKDNVIQLVRNTINSLGEAEREILILRDLQELSYDEISTILDIPLGTVKSKLNRARSSLKDRLKKIKQHL
jgi:RNA polymerase sigma-70 factor (ECF subfamily)